MKEDIKYAILNTMLKSFEEAKLKDATLGIKGYSFPFLYLHNHPALNHLTQPHGTQSSQLRDKLVSAGCLTKVKVKYFLTEEALKYLMDRRETSKSSEPNTKRTTEQDGYNFRSKKFIFLCVVGIISTFIGGYFLHKIINS